MFSKKITKKINIGIICVIRRALLIISFLGISTCAVYASENNDQKYSSREELLKVLLERACDNTDSKKQKQAQAELDNFFTIQEQQVVADVSPENSREIIGYTGLSDLGLVFGGLRRFTWGAIDTSVAQMGNFLSQARQRAQELGYTLGHKMVRAVDRYVIKPVQNGKERKVLADCGINTSWLYQLTPEEYSACMSAVQEYIRRQEMCCVGAESVVVVNQVGFTGIHDIRDIQHILSPIFSFLYELYRDYSYQSELCALQKLERALRELESAAAQWFVRKQQIRNFLVRKKPDEEKAVLGRIAAGELDAFIGAWEHMVYSAETTKDLGCVIKKLCEKTHVYGEYKKLRAYSTSNQDLEHRELYTFMNGVYGLKWLGDLA